AGDLGTSRRRLRKLGGDAQERAGGNAVVPLRAIAGAEDVQFGECGRAKRGNLRGAGQQLF
ncbi:MAG: hypothetical protein WB761_24340, partial [Solirubrobacteraceae bacterium]